MFGNDSGMKEKILQKILELFESLPDEGEQEQAPETEVAPEGLPVDKKELI